MIANPALSSARDTAASWGDDVRAVAALLEHADDAPELSLGAAQAIDHAADDVVLDLHVCSSLNTPGCIDC